MLSHYLTSALRHFRQQKLVTAINVVCLAIGFVCFTLAWGVAAYIAHADQHHSRAARTYIVTPTSDGVPTQTSSPWLLAERLAADYPTLEAIVRLSRERVNVVVGEERGVFAVAYAEPAFTRVFDLPFLDGDAAHALDSPRSAVVSDAFARRMFGGTAVIGRTMRLNNRETVTITGVLGEIPAPSHLSTDTSGSGLGVTFDALVSMDTGVALLNATARDRANQAFSRWSANWFTTYVVLPADGSLTAAQIDRQFDTFVKRHVPAEDGRRTYRLAPIADFIAIPFDLMMQSLGVSAAVMLQLFGALVLAIACMNYANLATAQARTSTKEVTLLKVIGASRTQLLAQYLLESGLLALAGFLLALMLISLGLAAVDPHAFAVVAGLFVRMPQFWVAIGATLAVVIVVASAYPALVLSAVRPAQGFRQGRAASRGRVAATVFVGLQFACASFLMIAVFVLLAQNRELRRSIVAAAEDPMVVIVNDLAAAGIDRQLLESELKRQRGIQSVSAIERPPWGIGGMGKELTTVADSTNAQVRPWQNIVDLDFFHTLQIPLIAGRDFEADRGEDLTDFSVWQRTNPETADSTFDFNAVIDRSLARTLGFATPADAIGRTVYHPVSSTGTQPPQRLHIIGVAEDATLRPINAGVTTNFYLLSPAAAQNVVVRLDRKDVPAALASMDAVWSKLAPGEVLQRRFADEQFERNYSFLGTINRAVAALSILAAIIAIMGLVAMALHVIRGRTHEIGVRKTLGAGATRILWMLLGAFSKPIVIANLAAWPLAYGLMRGYLSMFAHREGLSWTPFVGSLVISLAVAWIAVIVQATQAARLNPATVLRHE